MKLPALAKVIENAVDRNQLQDLLDDRALVQDSMDTSKVQRIREDMERAEARRLQPHLSPFVQPHHRWLAVSQPNLSIWSLFGVQTRQSFAAEKVF